MLTRSLGAALLAGALTLSGCASGSDSAAEAPASPEVAPGPPRPSAVVTPTADPQTARLQALAQVAEQAAASLAPSRTPAAPEVGADQALPGGDVSWPQCPRGMGIPERRTLGLPMPPASARFVVLGLTNGPGFTENPCLADQVQWVEDRHLLAAAYAVVSQPSGDQLDEHGGRGPFDADTDLGRLANTGYQQALAAVATMRRAGLETPIVWLDVEHVPDFEWSEDREANAAVVQGAAQAYADADYRVGVYSTPALWADVVGDLALGLPEWRPAGQSSRAQALDRCGDDWRVQGGDAVMVQWVADRRDLDVTCPGAVDRVGKWFRQY